jgi:hypothetical protein
MSQPNGEGQQPNDGGNSGYTPPATQEELNRIINERVQRERSKYADYKDLQTAAAELQQIRDQGKSAEQRAAEREAAAQAEVAKVPGMVAEALRAHLVTLHEISAEDAELFLTASEPELLLKQVQRLTDRNAQQKKPGNHAPREGNNPPRQPSDDPMRDFARSLFSGGE